jgi:hypothetical protein
MPHKETKCQISKLSEEAGIAPRNVEPPPHGAYAVAQGPLAKGVSLGQEAVGPPLGVMGDAAATTRAPGPSEVAAAELPASGSPPHPTALCVSHPLRKYQMCSAELRTTRPSPRPVYRSSTQHAGRPQCGGPRPIQSPSVGIGRCAEPQHAALTELRNVPCGVYAHSSFCVPRAPSDDGLRHGDMLTAGPL